MKKCFKTLCLLLTAIMLISTVGIASTVSCETGKATYYNGCMYAVYGEEVYITGCDRVTPVLNIPSVIDGRRVTRINDRAFGNCDIITYVSIPSTMEKISPDAFDGCTNLPQIDVDENNKNYCSVDGVIYSKDMTEIVIYPNGKKGDSYTLPDSVKAMDSAFMYCDNLKIVKFSSSMTQIDDYMFDNVRHFKRL